MTLDQIVSWYPILIGVGAAVYSHLTARGKVNSAQIDVIEQKHSDRINTLTTRVRVLEATKPSPDHLDQLHSRVNDVAKGLAGIEGKMEGQSRLLENILSALLKDAAAA